tara:strand:- start:16 stop:1050 length:1035 start_codon:yes stop_codon:yes gene_type:complete
VALQSTGAISLNDVHVELGGTTGTLVSLNDSDLRTLAGVSSGAISLQNFYGTSSVPPFDYTAANGAVDTNGPYYTLVSLASTGTVLASGTYNFVMVGRGGKGAGSASSIAFWTIQLNGTESWSFTTPTQTGSSYFTEWQIVGDNSTLVKVRHGTDRDPYPTAIGTMGSSSRLTNKAQRVGGAGVDIGFGVTADNNGRSGGGGSVDFFNLSDKTRLNGVQGDINGSTTVPSGGHIKESGNPASGTKWLTGFSDTDFEQAVGSYTHFTQAGHYNVSGSNGHSPFGGGGAASATSPSGSSIYINILPIGVGGYGGGGAFGRRDSQGSGPTEDSIGGPPALWYLRTGN